MIEQNVLLISTSLLGIYMSYHGLEVLFSKQYLQENGFVDWQLIKLQVPNTPFNPLLDRLMLHGNYLIIHSLRIIVGILLFTNYYLNLPLAPLLVSASLLTLLSSLCIQFGLDGSWHIQMITLLPLTICVLFPNIYAIKCLSFAFISSQICLAYFTSGAAKFFIKDWRNGHGLTCIMNSIVWGRRWFSHFLQLSSKIPVIISWIVIIT